MRMISLFAVLTAIAFGAPQALACQLREPPPIPPRIFWQDASDVVMGETAVEVSFVRHSRLTDPAHPSMVIIEGCGPSHRVYSIVRVLAGDAKADQEILVPSFHDFGDSNGILIGRLINQEEVGPDRPWALDSDPTLRILIPRLPPQSRP